MEPGATAASGDDERRIAEEEQDEVVVLEGSSRPAPNALPTAPEVPDKQGDDTEADKIDTEVFLCF